MQLAEPEVKEFFRLHDRLLLYVNRQLGLDPKIVDPETMKKGGIKKLYKIASALWADRGHLDRYCAQNPDGLNSKELELIMSWKSFVRGNFLVYKYTKENTVFIHIDGGDPPKAYGVMALNTPFPLMLGDRLPVLVETVLLPFRSRIITTGLIAPYNIAYGGNIRKTIDGFHEQAISEFGLITSLDGKAPARPTDEERLRRYLKNEANKVQFYDEIMGLVKKNETLRCIYYQEEGRSGARRFRKDLRASKITKGWFALLDGMIISGGTDRDAVEKSAKELVPKERWAHIYYFGLR